KELDHPVAGKGLVTGTPVSINGEGGTTAQMPPEHGANTEEVLLELGYSWGQIGSLRQARAVWTSRQRPTFHGPDCNHRGCGISRPETTRVESILLLFSTPPRLSAKPPGCLSVISWRWGAAASPWMATIHCLTTSYCRWPEPGRYRAYVLSQPQLAITTVTSHAFMKRSRLRGRARLTSSSSNAQWGT